VFQATFLILARKAASTRWRESPLRDLINRILDAAGVASVTRSVPAGLAYAAGWVPELLHGVFRPQDEPPMTRFVARELTTAHWFNIDAARRDLGYQPRISRDEGLRRLAASFRPGGCLSPALWLCCRREDRGARAHSVRESRIVGGPHDRRRSRGERQRVRRLGECRQ
jgi:hypothetical protein